MTTCWIKSFCTAKSFWLLLIAAWIASPSSPTSPNSFPVALILLHLRKPLQPPKQNDLLADKDKKGRLFFLWQTRIEQPLSTTNGREPIEAMATQVFDDMPKWNSLSLNFTQQYFSSENKTNPVGGKERIKKPKW